MVLSPRHPSLPFPPKVQLHSIALGGTLSEEKPAIFMPGTDSTNRVVTLRQAQTVSLSKCLKAHSKVHSIAQHAQSQHASLVPAPTCPYGLLEVYDPVVFLNPVLHRASSAVLFDLVAEAVKSIHSPPEHTICACMQVNQTLPLTNIYLHMHLYCP